jgi:hypothetical protein
MFNFDTIQYPAFIVVYGESKHYISTYNRSEYDEHFASEVCYSAEAARLLLNGYQGNPAHLKVYVVPHPPEVLQLNANGGATQEYSKED